MAQPYNIYTHMFETLYLKKTESAVAHKPISVEKEVGSRRTGKTSSSGTTVHSMIEQPMPMVEPKTPNDTFVFNWTGMGKTVSQTFTMESRNMIPNDSFIASILYAVDPTFYIADEKKQRRDVDGVIELIRGTILKHSKVTKEHADMLKQLEHHSYTDNVIQYIINWFGSFHCIVLNKQNTDVAPKLFLVGNTSGQKVIQKWTTASHLVVLLYDAVRESYQPIMPNENESTYWMSWRQPEFIQMIRRPLLWGKPAELKKWAVSDLRQWIQRFGLDIEVELDKKTILEKLEARGGLFTD